MSTTMISTEEVRTAGNLDPVNADSQVEHPPKDHLRQRAKKELRRRRRDASTFTTPLQKTPSMRPFFQDFYKNVHTPAKKEYYRNERQKHRSVDEYYKKLCGRSVSFEDFWQRYEYRCDLQRIMEELKMGGDDNGDAAAKKYSVSPTDVKEDQLFRDGETGTASTDENKDPQGTSEAGTDSTANKAQDPSSTAEAAPPDSSRANQAFKRRKSRLAKLVAAKKELRKAQQQQKAREQQRQEHQKAPAAKVEDASKPQEAMASMQDEAPTEETPTAPVHPETPEDTKADQVGEPVAAKEAVVDVRDVYRDEDAEERANGKKEKCECTACAIM